MKIHFCGGVKELTGSNFLVEKNDLKILIDCGLIQKEKFCSLENFLPFPYQPSEISFVFITHAHLDHIGRLPKLLREGFRGKIISTPPTKELAKEILLDSQKIIEQNCYEYNRENLYKKDDVEKLMTSWETIDYHSQFKLNGLEIEFFNSGHILGSAFIKILENKDKLTSVVFSGDLGNKDRSLMKELEPLPQTNYLILESTYGDRDHQDLFNRLEILEEVLEKVIYEKRVLIIPTFALEKSQEIIFDIQTLIEKKKVPKIKIFLDSPLAFRIAKIYEKFSNYLNDEVEKEIRKGDIFNKSYLRIIRDDRDEEDMFREPPPKVILAGSGMITGGRILKILDRYFSQRLTTILFIGYQLEGSLGRNILEGKIKTPAEILYLSSYSSHRDQSGILEWLKPQRFNLKSIFLTHGDLNSKKVLRNKIIDELAVETFIPSYKEIYEI